jgi:hypothetical protein
MEDRMKVTTLTLAATFAALTGFASADTDVLPAPGTTFTPYGSVEGWNIFVNDARKTCMIEKVDAEETVVQMGLTADRGFGYLGVFTKRDIGLDEGDEPVAVLIGENVYMGSARRITGGLRDGYTGGYIISDDPQFVEDVQQQYSMMVLPETDFAFVVNLAGTKKAIEAARACNAAQLN